MIRPAGDQALLIEFEQKVDPSISLQIMALERWLINHVQSGISDYVPGYSTLFIAYDPLVFLYDDLVQKVEQGLREVLQHPVPGQGKKLWVPVCYGEHGEEFGPDLRDVANHCGLTVQEVIELHTAPDYFVHFTGFLPNFPFLGGMSEKIATPRLPKPRQQVPGGSVAIAGEQTGFYPLSSPGGWRLIGKIPVLLYDLRRTDPFLFQPGDHIRFYRITLQEYRELEELDRKEPFQFRVEAESVEVNGGVRQ